MAGQRVCRIEFTLLVCVVLLAVGSVPLSAQLTPAQRLALPEYFGFSDIEIFKIENDIAALTAVDIDADGREDLVLANNRKSSIEVLMQRASADDAGPGKRRDDVNALTDHWRFARHTVPVNHQIADLQVAELTRDPFPDIVLFGEAKELVLLASHGDGTFAAPVARPVRDGVSTARAVSAGDLNADGHDDVAVLGTSSVWIFYQQPEGGLGRPVDVAHAVENPKSVDIADLDGNGHPDLVLGGSGAQPLLVRLQTLDGQLGPWQAIALPKLRGTWTLASCFGRAQADLIGIESVSGRLKRWQFEITEHGVGRERWPTMIYPFPATESGARSRPLAIGDVNGDGRDDVVSADPQAAQLLLYAQRPEGGLQTVERFGGQLDTRDLRLFDFDDDGRSEVAVCSANEKAIGVSHWQGRKLTFPKALETVGVPQVFDVRRIDGARSALAYVTKTDDAYELIVQVLTAQAAGDTLTLTADGEPQRMVIEDFQTEPSGLRWVDVDQNGLQDVLVFAPYEALVTYVQDEAGGYRRISGGSAQEGLVSEARISGFEVADVSADGFPEILLAQKSFVRALRLSEGRWEVVEQFNAPTAAAEILGVATIGSTESGWHLAMYDGRNREIHWLGADTTQDRYVVKKSVPASDFELQIMTAARLGSSKPELLLADARQFALMRPEEPAWRAVEKTVYETDLEDGRLWRVAVGDLNHDRRTDIVVSDAQENYIEIVTFGPQDEWVRAVRFKAFDQKQFRGGGRERAEPREMVIADFTGDGVSDLALVVHDRVIVYPAQ